MLTGITEITLCNSIVCDGLMHTTDFCGLIFRKVLLQRTDDVLRNASSSEFAKNINRKLANL